MAPEHKSGERKKRKSTSHTYTTTPAGFQFVCFFLSHFLVNTAFFVQNLTESGQITKGTSLSTLATTTHGRPVQHRPHQLKKKKQKKNGPQVQERFGKNWLQVPLMFTMLVKMELLQKTRCYCVCVKVNNNILVGFLMFFFFFNLS